MHSITELTHVFHFCYRLCDKTRRFIIWFRLSHYVKNISILHWANLDPLDGAYLCATRWAQST